MGEDQNSISSYALGLGLYQGYSLDTEVEEPKELSKLYWARSSSSRTTLSVEGGTFTES